MALEREERSAAAEREALQRAGALARTQIERCKRASSADELGAILREQHEHFRQTVKYQPAIILVESAPTSEQLAMAVPDATHTAVL